MARTGRGDWVLSKDEADDEEDNGVLALALALALISARMGSKSDDSRPCTPHC